VLDPARGPGVYLWRSCESETWSIRAVSGDGVRGFAGRFSAAEPLGKPIGRFLEGSDSVEKSRPNAIEFDLTLREPARRDGFDVDVSSEGWTCLRIAEPRGVTIYVGPDAAGLSGGSVNRRGRNCSG
jgi:hypothetical protein